MIHLQKYRRKFLRLFVMGSFTALFAGIHKKGVAAVPTPPLKGILIHADEGEHILTGRRKVPITIKISKEKDGVENISFCMETMTTGRKMRVHRHLYHDEIIFIHQGQGMMTLDNREIAVKAGAVAFIPRGVWHGLDNNGANNLVMTFGYSPAGFENYFKENGIVEGTSSRERTEEEYKAAQEKYGMVYR